MSETEEIPVAFPEMYINKKELDLAARGAIIELKRAEADPIVRAGTAAGELGFFAALGDIVKSDLKEGAGVAWKDAKTIGISFLGLVSHARELSGSARAVRQANKAAYYAGKAGKELAKSESGLKSLWAIVDINQFSKQEAKMLENAVSAIPRGSQAEKRFGKAIADHFSVREALHFAQHGLPPKGKIEGGVAWIKHAAITEIPKLVDPFPDVPDAVKKGADVFDKICLGSTLVALLPPAAPIAAPVAAVSGMIGVGVPAAWQFIHNRVEGIRLQQRTEEKVWGLVKGTVKKRLGWTKGPDATRAARVFQPVHV